MKQGDWKSRRSVLNEGWSAVRRARGDDRSPCALPRNTFQGPVTVSVTTSDFWTGENRSNAGVRLPGRFPGADEYSPSNKSAGRGRGTKGGSRS